MLIVNIYGLLPAFTLGSLLTILLWPEDIAFKKRLRLSMVIIGIWVVASFLEMMGIGTAEKSLSALINMIVGIFGWVALFATYQTKPVRGNPPPSAPSGK